MPRRETTLGPGLPVRMKFLNVRILVCYLSPLEASDRLHPRPQTRSEKGGEGRGHPPPHWIWGLHLLPSSWLRRLCAHWQVKIMTEKELLAVACEQFLGKNVQDIKNVVLQTLEGHLRSILGETLPSRGGASQAPNQGQGGCRRGRGGLSDHRGL